MRDGLRLLRRNASLRRIVLAGLITDPLPYVLLFLYQPYFEAAGTPLALFGIAAALAAGVGAIAAREAHRLDQRLGPRRAFQVVCLLPALLYLGMATTSQAYLAAVLYVFCFGIMQARYPLLAALRNMHIASYNRATALSLISMFSGAWVLIWNLILGRLADVGLSWAFLVLAALPLLGLLILRFGDDDVRVDAP